MQNIEELRKLVLAEAPTWINTPFVHGQKLKGAGCDCVGLLLGVYSAAGAIHDFTPEHYPHDWHMHRDAERYIAGILKFAVEIPGPPAPGDVALYRFGRTFSHAVIVIDWPLCIHAYVGRPVEWVNVEQDHTFTRREVKFFSLGGEQ